MLNIDRTTLDFRLALEDIKYCLGFNVNQGEIEPRSQSRKKLISQAKELNLRDNTRSGPKFPKEKLISQVFKRAMRWNIAPNIHVGLELLPNLAIDLCHLYRRLYDQAKTPILKAHPAFLDLEEPVDPRTLAFNDSYRLKRSIQQHFAMLVSLYETVLTYHKEHVSYLSWGLYEAYMAMSVTYLRDLNPYFAYEAYEIYEPGSKWFVENYELSYSDLQKSLQGISKMALVGYQHRQAPIVIAYRDSACGKGALFDHRTIQQITKRPTMVALPPKATLNDFYKAICDLSCGKSDNPADIVEGAFYPPLIATEDEIHSGLLVVTGRAPVKSRSAHDRQVLRNIYERPLIRQVYNARQPYLGICGGMWQTLAALRNIHVNIHDGEQAGLFDTPAHRGQMPSLNKSGQVVSNQVEHDLTVSPSILKELMQLKIHDSRIPGNSVHWQSIRNSALPDIVKVAATSSNDNSDITEAFVPKSDAPQVVVQWHPEAFSNDTEPAAKPHHELIKSLTRDADVFYKHYQVQEELRLSKKDCVDSLSPGASRRITKIISELPKLFD